LTDSAATDYSVPASDVQKVEKNPETQTEKQEILPAVDAGTGSDLSPGHEARLAGGKLGRSARLLPQLDRTE
jgi:hypothetical protein